MSSVAQTQPRTGRRYFNLRAYLAGTAATAALLGAVVIAFASLGAYVAFNGLPIGGSSAATDTSISVGHAANGVSARSRDKRTSAAANAQRSQDSRSHAGGSRTETATGGTETTTIPSTTAAVGTSAGQPTVTTTGAQQTVTAGPSSPSPGGGSGGSPTIPTPNVTAPDAVGSSVGTVEQTLHDAGVDVPVGGSGSAADQVVGGLLGGN